MGSDGMANFRCLCGMGGLHPCACPVHNKPMEENPTKMSSGYISDRIQDKIDAVIMKEAGIRYSQQENHMTEHEIIDFSTRGNVVRFFLGKNGKQGGDDWNDRPYEHNAGQVYDEYVKGHKDVAFDFDDLVLEPCAGECNSPYCKDDMVARRVACIIVVSKEVRGDEWNTDFKFWNGNSKVKKYYFGDDLLSPPTTKEQA